MDMLEIFTEIMFDAAVIIMIFKIVHNIKNDNLTERFTAITMGFGFLIYCILKVLSGGTGADLYWRRLVLCCHILRLYLLFHGNDLLC